MYPTATYFCLCAQKYCYTAHLFSLSPSLFLCVVDLKPEGFPLTQLRNKEGEPWRKVMDLERALCFSSAKINSIVFMGNMMVMYISCIYFLLHCNCWLRLLQATASTWVICLL